jgi:GT2 family glycosyltransferase
MIIGFVFTNYNNSNFTREVIKSISLNNNYINSRIVIVDNNSEEEDINLLHRIKLDFPNIHIIFNNNNFGYFKGLNVGIKHLRDNFRNVNHIVVGNNDIIFPDNFIDILINNKNIFDNYAVISPDIITLDGGHQNPHVLKRISQIREFIWDCYYLNYRMAIMIKYVANVTSKFTKMKDYQEHNNAQVIYLGYGACYILGPIFFQNYDLLWDPTFLLGEEAFFSEQLKRKNLQIYYYPKLIVKHHDHVSINKISGKDLWIIARKSHGIYRNHVKNTLFYTVLKNRYL